MTAHTHQSTARTGDTRDSAAYYVRASEPIAGTADSIAAKAAVPVCRSRRQCGRKCDNPLQRFLDSLRPFHDAAILIDGRALRNVSAK